MASNGWAIAMPLPVNPSDYLTNQAMWETPATTAPNDLLAEELPPPGVQVIECGDTDDDGMCNDVDMETGEEEEENDQEN
ncbi:MAG: hypothetical protein KC474_12000 [Cyanobacteria bacterium HKST-UBA04]|nr:hypothetical protein [Cyanobacteria bacterium HKST-UBA04]